MNGTNKVDGKYVYGANPQITLDPRSIKLPLSYNPKTVVAGVPVVAAQTPAPKTVEATQEDLDLAESLGEEFGYMPNISVDTIVQPSLSLTPISLEVLQELYTFTPSGIRNGKTPEEVLEEMIQMGIPYIAEGHNPFIKCN